LPLLLCDLKELNKGKFNMTQKQSLISSLKEGREFTAKQIASQFKIGSPTKVVSELRRDGYAIYLNRRVDTKGRETMKYRLGTPRRAHVAVAAHVVGAQAFGA
jgi:Helix-turn-helix domain